MTEERRLLYIHKVLHEDAKHRQEDNKTLQKEQVASMKQLLAALKIEEDFAAFCKNQDSSFLATQPNTCPTEAEVKALSDLKITALSFPCIRFADNGKSAKGMWLAETKEGEKAIAARFLKWGEEWKLWALVLEPTTDDLPAEGYERCYPDPKEMPPASPQFGGPGGPPPGGPVGPGGPGGPAPGGPAPGGPEGPGGPGPGGPGPGGPGGPGGGEDSPPFDPDARSDVFDLEGDYARLNKDIDMLANMALPDYRKDCEAANEMMTKCRIVASPAYIAKRMKNIL